jgi:hypothetical protein
MTEARRSEDPLNGWDPRRRTALERLWGRFKAAGGDEVSLSDELLAERRLEAAAEDQGHPRERDDIGHRGAPSGSEQSGA